MLRHGSILELRITIGLQEEQLTVQSRNRKGRIMARTGWNSPQSYLARDGMTISGRRRHNNTSTNFSQCGRERILMLRRLRNSDFAQYEGEPRAKMNFD